MFEDSDISPKVITSSLFIFLVLVLTIFVLSLELWETKMKLASIEESVELAATQIIHEDIPYDTPITQEVELEEDNTSIKVRKPDTQKPDVKPETSQIIEEVETTDKGYDGKLDGKYGLFQSFFSDDSWGKNMTRESFTNTWGEENIEVINEQGEVRVLYPQGSYKPSVFPRGGAGFIYAIGEKFEELTLSYDITLAENFNFVKGGKLPGLCGGDCSRGSEDASDGFSVNFLWKSDGYVDSVISSHSDIIHNATTKKQNFKMSPGNTYNLKLSTKLNTPGRNDGLLLMYVDGTEIYRNEEINLRNNSEIMLDSVLFSSFFGGGDTSWATPVNTSIVFNNFSINGK